MEKDKIAFVVVRYGQNINGGAEYHCRMLAERLMDDFSVEVLTTCVNNYSRMECGFPEGTEVVNGVLVRRFKVEPIAVRNKKMQKRAKTVRRLRMFLYHIRLLQFLSYFKPVWNWRKHEELTIMQENVFYSPQLYQFIKKQKDSYKAFIAFTIDYIPFYYTAILAGEKSIAIPTMHCTKISFKGIWTEAFSKFAYIGFNTKAELKLGKQVFGKAMKKYGIISVGIEETQPVSWNLIQEKYDLPTDYLLYVGRINSDKVGCLFDYFRAYKKKYPQSKIKLVLVGGLDSGWKPFKHIDVIYTGFVSDEEKLSIIQHATVTVNPSNYESLSLILLEALSQEKMMLVNGHCDVLKEHCKNSGYAADYYMNKKQFVFKLHKIVGSEDLRKQKGLLGKQYVAKNYNWDLIIGRLRKVINDIRS